MASYKLDFKSLGTSEGVSTVVDFGWDLADQDIKDLADEMAAALVTPIPLDPSNSVWVCTDILATESRSVRHEELE